MLVWLASSRSLVEMIAWIQLFNQMESEFYWALQLRCDACFQDEWDVLELDGFALML